MSTPPLRTRLAGLSLGLGLLAVAACGATDVDAAGTTTTSTSTAPESSSTSTTSTTTSSTSEPGDDATFCSDAEDFVTLARQADDDRESGDLAAYQQTYGELVDALERLVDEAPAAVDDETRAVAGAFAALEDDVERAESTDEIHDLRDSPELAAASDDLEAFGRYLQQSCDIQT